MKKVFGWPESLKETITHYCSGCGHGIVQRLIAEVVDELGIRERTIGIAPVGCAVLAYNYFNFDVSEAAHGRTPAVATGMKRARPECVVFSYQGDGDLAAIGTAEIVHAANRGENITVIFVNNAVYGMTGGQMAPTTLLNQVTETTPSGRRETDSGPPLRIIDMLAVSDGTKYLARTAVDSPEHVMATKRALKKAFGYQIDGLGFSLVEILSPCATYWKQTPLKSLEWLRENMIPAFPLGEIKDAGKTSL